MSQKKDTWSFFPSFSSGFCIPCQLSRKASMNVNQASLCTPLPYCFYLRSFLHNLQESLLHVCRSLESRCLTIAITCLKVETISNLFIKMSVLASRVPDTQSVFIEHYLDEGINVSQTDLHQNTSNSFFLLV